MPEVTFSSVCLSLKLYDCTKDPTWIYQTVGQWFCEHRDVTCKALRGYAKEKHDLHHDSQPGTG